MKKNELHPQTIVHTRSQKSVSRKARIDALDWLANKFPEAFDNTTRIRPLKIGIMDDILQYSEEALQEGISRSKLREAVVVFSRRIDYLTCLKARETRIDLMGNPVMPVSEEEAEKAASKIKKRVEKSAKILKPTGYTKSSPSNGFSSFAPPDSRNHQMDDQFPVYPTRAPVANQTSKAPPVVITRKAAKPIDLEAVARLKEKLGLSRKTASAEAVE